MDLSTHRPVDVLADRSAETFSRWRKRASWSRSDQPGPSWHLIRNLAVTLDAILRRQAPFQRLSRKTVGSRVHKHKLGPPNLRLTPTQQRRREHQHERFGQIQGLYEQGRSLREIAGSVEIDTNTLRYGCRTASHGPRLNLIGDAKQEMPA